MPVKKGKKGKGAKANTALWEARCDLTRVHAWSNVTVKHKITQQLTDLLHNTEKNSIEIIAALRNKDLQNEEKAFHAFDHYSYSTYTHGFLFKSYSHIVNHIVKWLIYPTLEMSSSVHLEKEAEQKIAVLAERAHNEAIVQLDDASRSMFKENARLNKALGYHIKEVEDLRKRNAALAEENNILSLHKVRHTLAYEEADIYNDQSQRSTVFGLRAKVFTLEQALASRVAEFEWEKADIKECAAVRSQDSGVELDKLQKLLSVRDRELSQRSDMEILFYEALNHVKQEMLMHRCTSLFIHSYTRGWMSSGRRENAHIHTINRTPHSTSIGMDEAEKGNLKKAKVNISEMAWEQRERVLRLVFAKMNNLKSKNEEKESHASFLTQAAVSSMSSSVLPDL
uniref:Basal body-orientation factor 1 n=1 Tax=Sinocyclocheilus grahami TaxID=75366 RepID=A0A672KAD0_SINGR